MHCVSKRLWYFTIEINKQTSSMNKPIFKKNAEFQVVDMTNTASRCCRFRLTRRTINSYFLFPLDVMCCANYIVQDLFIISNNFFVNCSLVFILDFVNVRCCYCCSIENTGKIESFSFLLKFWMLNAVSIEILSNEMLDWRKRAHVCFGSAENNELSNNSNDNLHVYISTDFSVYTSERM